MSDDDLKDQALAESARKVLRESEQLDYVTASKLRAARARALSPAGRRRPWRPGLPLALAVAAALVVMAPWHRWIGQIAETPPVAEAEIAELSEVAEIEALEVLADDLGPEFYADLDFYLWLAQDAQEPDDYV